MTGRTSSPLPAAPLWSAFPCEADGFMALEQSIDQALARTIGAGGLPEVALEAGLRLVDNALTRLREDNAGGRLPLLHMPRTTDDLAAIRDAAARLTCEATDVV